MKSWLSLLRRGVLLSAIALMAACGGGGGGGGDADTNPSAPPPDASAPEVTDRPVGLYWSWTSELTPVIGAGGFTTWITVFKYDYASFFDSGYAYVGPPTAGIADIRCTVPTQDADGNDLCVPYTAQAGQIKIGDRAAVSLAKTPYGWDIDGKPYKPLPALHDQRLDGSYRSNSCYLALCSNAAFVFRPDGTFTASRDNTYANAMADLFVGATSSTDLTGTYRIEGHGIALQPQGAAGGTVFFFIDGDSLQIGDDWYLKD